MALQITDSDGPNVGVLNRWANGVEARQAATDKKLAQTHQAVVQVQATVTANSVAPNDPTGVSVVQTGYIIDGVLYSEVTASYNAPNPLGTFAGVFLVISGYRGSSELVKVTEHNFAGAAGSSATFKTTLQRTNETVTFYFVAKDSNETSRTDWVNAPNTTTTLNGNAGTTWPPNLTSDTPFNGDFEQFTDSSVVADGWTKDFETSGAGFSYARSSSPVSGVYAQSILNGAGGTGIASRPFGVKAGAKYTFRCYAKSTVANPGTMYFRVLWYSSDSDLTRTSPVLISMNDIVTAGGPTVSNTFQVFTAEFSAPSTAIIARIAVYNFVGTSCTITFDRVQAYWSTLDQDNVPNGTRAAWDSTTQKGAAVDAAGNLLLKNVQSPAATTADPFTASTSYVVIPEMTVTITTKGNAVLVTFTGVFSVGCGGLAALFRDSTQLTADFSIAVAAAATDPQSVTLTIIDTGASAASHTYAAKWKKNTGNAATVGTQRSFQVVELG